MKTVLTVKCGWCGRLMYEKDGEGVSGVSHGICPDCLVKQSMLKLKPLSQDEAKH